jgi:hypothetical protein
MLPIKNLYKKGCSLSMVKTGVCEVNSGAKMPKAFLPGNRQQATGNYAYPLKNRVN